MQMFKSIMKVLIIVSFITIIYFGGRYSAKYQLEQENKKSTIATIAVVNADTGTMVDGEKKFYASELMAFPDTNFKSTGLEDAREGIVDGRYAAYILIPENFSASIESVNREPEKSQITYAVYDDLRQDVQNKVVNDIHNFILTLSTNISYIYVDAILEEMHSVQDDSEMIMQNDIADMEAIIGVETAELIAEVEYEPLEVTEIEIKYMDLTDDYETVNNTVEEICNTYIANMQKAEEEFAAIKERSVGLGNLLTEVSETFSSVDILVDEEDENVCEEGMTELLGIVQTYEDGRNKKLEAKKSLGYQVEGEDTEEEEESGYVMTYLKGLVLTSAYSKDPVNLSTGNFYYEKEDLKINGPIPLTFRRWYNAMDKASSVLGEGWSHTDSAHLSFLEGKAVLHARILPLYISLDVIWD